MRTLRITMGSVPNTLEKCNRAALPPMLVCTICRTVWLSKPSSFVIDEATDQVPVQDTEEGTTCAKSDSEYCNAIAAANVSRKSRQIDLLMSTSGNDGKKPSTCPSVRS